MKLYIQQKVFSWADRFTVQDEAGRDCYSVVGELFTWGKKLHVYGADGGEAAFIRQRVFSFLPRYEVFVGGELAAEIVKEFTLLRPRYRIDGLGWDIDGSFWAHDYEITKQGRGIVSIHKAWMSWGDCYELDVADPADTLTALAVVLAIDCVMASASSSANN